MADETLTRRGGRRVELISPIKHGEREIDAIEIAPAKLDHVLRWTAGQIAGSLALMAELTGLDIETLRQLEYPDVDRVIGAFIANLPDSIRQDVGTGVVPRPASEVREPIEPPSDDSGHGFDPGLTDAPAS